MTGDTDRPDEPGPAAGRRAPRVFVSYSHRDEPVLKELLPFLDTLERQGLIALWSDQQIEGGQRWRAEIGAALNAATIAVLLISQDFLVSLFVRDQELPRILQQQQAGQMTVLPVFVSPSTVRSDAVIFRDSEGREQRIVLSEFQGFGSPEETLSELELPARQRLFVDLNLRIRELATGSPAPSPAPSVQMPPEQEKRTTPGPPPEQEERTTPGPPPEQEKHTTSGPPPEQEKRTTPGTPPEQEKRTTPGAGWKAVASVAIVVVALGIVALLSVILLRSRPPSHRRSLSFNDAVTQFENGSAAGITGLAAHGDEGIRVLVDSLDATGESKPERFPLRTLGIIKVLHEHPKAFEKYRSTLNDEATRNREKVESLATTIEASRAGDRPISDREAVQLEQLAHVAICMNQLLGSDPPDWPELAVRVRVLLRTLPVCQELQ